LNVSVVSNEAWRVSDMYKMLNGEEPGGSTRVQYSNQKAIRELGISFRPAKEPLSEFAGLVSH
jgi:hypothetical protein